VEEATAEAAVDKATVPLHQLLRTAAVEVAVEATVVVVEAVAAAEVEEATAAEAAVDKATAPLLQLRRTVAVEVVEVEATVVALPLLQPKATALPPRHLHQLRAIVHPLQLRLQLKATVPRRPLLPRLQLKATALDAVKRHFIEKFHDLVK
jgi:hypothetical protein